MPPIPTKQKMKPQQPQPRVIRTEEVYDDFGRPLDYLLRSQTRKDDKQSDNIKVARQHAQQNDSDNRNNVLIYRDVFPDRKYKLTLSDVSWISGNNTVTIGYTVGDSFTEITYDQDDNVFSFQLPDVSAIDTVEVRFVGNTDVIRGYLEDTSTSSNIWDKITKILEDIIGIKNRVTDLERKVKDLDDRVTALENR